MRLTPAPGAPVFLDRDGTLIVEKHYLSDPDGVCLEAGVVEGLRALTQLGHPLIVLSNQSGIGRRLFTEGDAQRVNARVSDRLREHGIQIMAWYLCPHDPATACTCRKPLPGMALAASRDWDLSLPGCYVIGDKKTDLELADAIGGTGLLVRTGYGREYVEWATRDGRPVFDDLGGAAAFIAARDVQAAAVT